MSITPVAQKAKDVLTLGNHLLFASILPLNRAQATLD